MSGRKNSVKNFDKGLFTYYVSRWRGGEGVSQKMTIADEGGRGGRPEDDDC